MTAGDTYPQNSVISIPSRKNLGNAPINVPVNIPMELHV